MKSQNNQNIQLRTSTVDCEICNDKEMVFEQRDGDWVAVPCKCKEQKAIKRMLKASGLTVEQMACKLNDFKPSAATMGMFRLVQQYLREYPVLYKQYTPSKGLALTGKVGTGKTMLATVIANEFLARRIPTVFVVTPSLMGELLEAQFSDDGLEGKIHKLSSVDVCIFDDVGKEKPTRWVQTQYFRIVDNRYRKHLPTIFTSNFYFDEIAEQLGDAVASRLYALTKGRQVFVDAADYRVTGGR